LLKRISITGPECTGKTWLAKRLSTYYKTTWVPEYAVEYLQKKGAEYNREDILKIAKGQLYDEELKAKEAEGILFCDTDLIVNKIWSQVVFKEVPEWISDKVKKHQYDLYLLCFPDIEWRPSPFRENPTDRHRIFSIYEIELQRNEFNYRVVKGEGESRFENAVKFVEELL
jgi:NadR type nicotinamide-nucleotide adenylyltransferase